MAYGNRYTKEEKEEILEFRKTHTCNETMAKFGISLMTLSRWNRQDREEYRKQIRQQQAEGKIPKELPKEECQTLLKVIKAFRGITDVLLIDDEGNAVASILAENKTPDLFLGSTVALLAAHQRTLEMIGSGKLQMIISQSDENLMIILGVSERHVLTILYEGKSDIQKIFAQDMPIIERIGKTIAGF